MVEMAPKAPIYLLLMRRRALTVLRLRLLLLMLPLRRSLG
jgi:hypothetical protein